MYAVDSYAAVRRFVFVEGKSRRETARVFGLSRDTNRRCASFRRRRVEARDRVFSEEEIKAFWKAASKESWAFSSVFKVLLLTGQRREEVAGMRWREVDLDAGKWTIAKERCKKRQDAHR